MPDPILKGRFNLYETPDGGYHIAYLPDGDDETKHFEIPAMVIRMARMAADGKMNPARMLKDLLSNAPA